MRHIGRHVDEIARPRLGGEFQIVAPAHPGAAFTTKITLFEVSMVMRARLGVGMNMHRARQSFSAPARARLMAVARFMPGVWAVLGSSSSPGTTFHAVSRQSTLPGAGASCAWS